MLLEDDVQTQYYQTSSNSFFIRKTVKPFHFFNEIQGQLSVSQKEVWLRLHLNLNFSEQFHEGSSKLKKAYRSFKNCVIYCQEMCF